MVELSRIFGLQGHLKGPSVCHKIIIGHMITHINNEHISKPLLGRAPLPKDKVCHNPLECRPRGGRNSKLVSNGRDEQWLIANVSTMFECDALFMFWFDFLNKFRAIQRCQVVRISIGSLMHEANLQRDG